MRITVTDERGNAEGDDDGGSKSVKHFRVLPINRDRDYCFQSLRNLCNIRRWPAVTRCNFRHTSLPFAACITSALTRTGASSCNFTLPVVGTSYLPICSK